MDSTVEENLYKKYSLLTVCGVCLHIFADVFVSSELTGYIVDWGGRNKCLGQNRPREGQQESGQDRQWPLKEGTSV